MRALKRVYPELDDYEAASGGCGRMAYPRPISEPPSPSSSRAASPVPSDSDSADSEAEVQIEKLKLI